MHRYSAAIDGLAIGVGILILVAIVADPVIAPAPVIPTADASSILPFDLMAKAEDLPAEMFAAI